MSDEATAPDDAAAVDRVLAELRTTLTQLSTEIGQNRRRLAELQAEVESTRAQIERLLERGRPSPQAIPAAAPEPAETGPSRPLVRIRFDQPSIDYLDALHEAVQTALAQLPDAGFEVVAVASLEARESDAAERHAATVHAEEVMTTLLDMGVPPSQLTLSLATIREARGNEVRIYIR